MGGELPLFALVLCMLALPVVVAVLAWRTGHNRGWFGAVALLAPMVWSGPTLFFGHEVIGNRIAYRVLDDVIVYSSFAYVVTMAIGLFLVCKRWEVAP